MTSQVFDPSGTIPPGQRSLGIYNAWKKEKVKAKDKRKADANNQEAKKPRPHEKTGPDDAAKAVTEEAEKMSDDGSIELGYDPYDIN